MSGRRFDLRVVTDLDEPWPELLRFRNDVEEFAARFYPDLTSGALSRKRRPETAHCGVPSRHTGRLAGRFGSRGSLFGSRGRLFGSRGRLLAWCVGLLGR